MVLDIHGHTDSVLSVDISPTSTKFATGGFDKQAFIHSITTGEKLVGPLEHDAWVVTVRFSPNGDRLATATGDEKDTTSIRIYDSDNADGRQLFAATLGEVKCFDTSSGALLNKRTIPGAKRAYSIVLARYQNFAVAVTSKSLFFWDTSTGQRIGSVIELASSVWSISLSPNDDHIVTGEENGKITIRSLRDILPSSYLTVNVGGSTC
ncbi:WD40-repeat-containing domain protein [Boletus reticuloceps]|uniref:WD40-repeat-containing domain protein n=1 Tax=Boletus reticuloceps TaxID=495285 RepID=A0A8I3ABG7_9AGAM|nr:WD40-repeat-containing domain protein [Boletus reticuloceps]